MKRSDVAAPPAHTKRTNNSLIIIVQIWFSFAPVYTLILFFRATLLLRHFDSHISAKSKMRRILFPFFFFFFSAPIFFSPLFRFFRPVPLLSILLLSIQKRCVHNTRLPLTWRQLTSVCVFLYFMIACCCSYGECASSDHRRLDNRSTLLTIDAKW